MMQPVAVNNSMSADTPGIYRLCVVGVFFLMVVFAPVSAADTMFRADPLHTGVFTGGGIVPGNTSAWHFATAAPVTSSPAVADDTVYAGSDDRNLYAIDAGTGQERWRLATNGSVSSSPAVSGGVVYAGSDDRNLYAIDAGTGKERWRLATNGSVSSSPAVSGGVVYVGSDDDNLYALDAATGKERWVFATQGDVSSSPAVSGGVVYAGSDDRNLYAVNAVTGRQLWLFKTRNYIQSSPAVAGGIVYVGSNDKYLYAVDLATGTEKWRFATGGAVTSSPAVANGIVYVGSQDTNLYAIDAATGKETWRFSAGRSFPSSPAVANGIIYAGSLDGNLYAVDAMTGTEKWRFVAGNGIYSSPAVADGVVYVGNYDGNLYAVGGKTPAPVATPAEAAATVSPQPASPPGSPVTENGFPSFEIIALLSVVILIGLGRFVLHKNRKVPQKIPATGPDTTPQVREQSPLPEAGTGKNPAEGPATGSFAGGPGTSPHPVVTPSGSSPLNAPRPDRAHPEGTGSRPASSESDPFTARLDTLEKKAAALSLFRHAAEDPLSRSRDPSLRKNIRDAEHAADEAETAIRCLQDCEYRLEQWREQGYDTARLAGLENESAGTILSAIGKFDDAVRTLETIRLDLEALKNRYHPFLSQAGFPAAVLALEQHLKKTEDASLAASELERLKHDISAYAEDIGRKKRALENDITRIRQSVPDRASLADITAIENTLKSGDLQGAEHLFAEMVSRKEARVIEDLESLGKEGAVIPASILPARPPADAREYGDRLIEAGRKLAEAERLRAQFREASALRTSVTDSRLAALFDSGNYEEFIMACRERAALEKERGLIFISAKSEDFDYANLVYTFLKGQGYSVFFSQQSLPFVGNSDYRKEIDRALDNAKHMIVVTSRREYAESPWVEAEWGFFVNEKRSGRKTGNILTLIAGSMQIANLPGSLRYYEVRPLDPGTFTQILNYIH